MNDPPSPSAPIGTTRRRRLGMAILGIALIIPAVAVGVVAAFEPGLAWVAPAVWFLGMPGWLLVWIGVRLVRGRRPFRREPPGGRGR